MNRIELVEVGPRDGFQAVEAFIPTERKVAILEALYTAGVRRVEATSFVSDRAVPQLADARDILAAVAAMDGLDAQVLVPTARYCQRALEAGTDHFAFVLSVSEAHNRNNVKRSPEESGNEYAEIVRMIGAGTPLRLNLATAFDCPFEGAVAPQAVLALLDRLVPLAPWAEVALCDTTGKAMPHRVAELFTAARQAFPEVVSWAFHGHDTYGLGASNALAAYSTGVRVFDASVGGLGGCPFAPGATGNVATEDLVWLFRGMDLETGIDLDRLVAVSSQVKALPGAQTGGRVHAALTSGACTA